MKRLLVAIAVVAAAGSAARAQTDSIQYYDREVKKEKTVSCTIEQETPAQVVIREGVRQKKIPAGDVRDITYDKSVGPGNLVDYRRATNNEKELDRPNLDPSTRQRAFKTALEAYGQLLKEAKNPAVKRQAQFCIARLLVRQSEDDPSQVAAAVAELQKFVTDYGDGWQLTQAVKLLGQLQEGQGNYAAAQKTYEALAANADVAPQTREEAELYVARLLLRARRPAEAKARLDKLARSLKPSDPEANKVQVYLAQCAVADGKADAAEGKLREMLKGSLDPASLALAYNALGDIARQRGQDEEAFWDYLWVDVVYNQDRHEQAKALYYLAELFVKVKNDPARAQQCRQRLLDKEFLGLEYQKLAKEKPQ